eukprot:scaffold279_cov229-Pinguiococcus_pyrenoidosus.AAC.24
MPKHFEHVPQSNLRRHREHLGRVPQVGRVAHAIHHFRNASDAAGSRFVRRAAVLGLHAFPREGQPAPRGRPDALHLIRADLDRPLSARRGVDSFAVPVDEPDPILDANAVARQADVRVVRSQRDAPFRTAREHAVRLRGPFGRQVVDEHADVSLVPMQNKGVQGQGRGGRVRACDDPLRCSLLVAGGAVDLPSQEQGRLRSHGQRPGQLPGVDEVVLDVVARALKLDRFQALDRPKQLELHFLRKGPRKALRIHEVGVLWNALGLEPDEMPISVGEVRDLGGNAGAVARSRPGVVGQQMQRVADDGVRALVGVGLVARLQAMDVGKLPRITPKAQGRQVRPRLGSFCFQALEINGGGQEPRGRPRLHPRGSQPERLCKSHRKRGSRRLRLSIAVPARGPRAQIAPSGPRLLPDVHSPTEKRARRHDHRLGFDVHGVAPHAHHAHATAALLQQQIVHRRLDDPQAAAAEAALLVVAADPPLHLRAEQIPIRLHARTPHGRSLPLVQHFEVDARLVRHLRQEPSQRVHLAHQVSLAHSAHRWIAAELADAAPLLAHQHAVRTGARSRRGRLATRVAAANHHHVAREAQLPPAALPQQRR